MESMQLKESIEATDSMESVGAMEFLESLDRFLFLDKESVSESRRAGSPITSQLFPFGSLAVLFRVGMESIDSGNPWKPRIPRR